MPFAVTQGALVDSPATTDMRELARRVASALRVGDGGGTLVHGPAGCGKSRLAHMLADHLASPVLFLDAQRVCRPRSGSAEAALQAELDVASAAAPCVLVMDDIDVLVPASARPGSIESRLALQLADAVQRLRHGAVYFVGMCRDVGTVHTALRRSGRLHHQIAIRAPSPLERADILEGLAGMALLPPGDERLRAVVRSIGVEAHGLCGAQLAGLCQRAAAVAWRRGELSLTQ